MKVEKKCSWDIKVVFSALLYEINDTRDYELRLIKFLPCLIDLLPFVVRILNLLLQYIWIDFVQVSFSVA